MTKTEQTLHIDEYGYPVRPDSRRILRNLVVRGSRRLLLAAIYLFMQTIGSWLQFSRRQQHFSPIDAQSFRPCRILVIRVDLIGDLVLSLTTVRALKRTYPEAEIDLLATPASGRVIVDDPDLAEVITYDPNIWRRPKALLQQKNWREAFSLRRRLRARHYDLALSVSGPWAAIIAVLSGAKRTIGFAQEGYPGLLTDPVPGRHWAPDDHKHEVDYCLELLQAAGVIPTPADRIPHLTAPSTAVDEVEHLLQNLELRADKPLIACHVSANNGQSKRWPIPYWAILLDQLIAEDGANVILTGAPNDLPLIEQITQRMHQQALNLAGKTSLSQLAALLQRTDLLLTGDSGPMHIAAAVGTPLIAIHGPTDPALSGPISPKATVLRSDIWCSPCYTAQGPADCRFHTTQCMKNITPAQVYATIQEKLHVPTTQAEATS
ncbi:MAG TPA: lipopolysaccharide heptosyltransferase II [Ktedonobacteraceae bacterium]|nr:lipopolysaccharide heptosyltransferase II [Ktedonobacteraceae bacterium]